MNTKIKKMAVGLLAAATLGLGFAPVATAATDSQATSSLATTGPTADQYFEKTTTFRERTEGGGLNDSGGGLNDSVGSLPFTGLDVIAMLAVALTVTGLGLALQRAVSREPRHLE
jgi:hypothetical protein